MGVMCQILIDRTEDGVLKAGGLVTGRLKYFIDKLTQYRRITMCLLGKGKCTWSERRGKTTKYYSNSEEYTNQIVNLYVDTNKQELISGAFEYPFQFLLPIDIPPSFKDNTCYIRYKITVTFVKANTMKSKKAFDVEIPVTSYVNPCSLEPMMFCLRKKIFSFTPFNKIEVKGEISKTCITPGHNFQMTLTVNNETNQEIFIKTELVSRLTYIASCNHKKIYEENVKNTSTMSSIAANSVANLICVVPTLEDLSSVEHTKVMRGEYKVKVTAKLQFPHINAVLYIPVAIGLRKHEFVIPAAIYYHYYGEQPSCSTMSPHNYMFVC
ncbi:uncharacterized protein LOC111348443 [Spodoptera litura]|uniref:Uncharacterized protein LOC111348443 n=1 Tax=Spodoptera litura TaxID=69820 RepID=A0A9J7DPA3_SPOLT|nr:uncharacterized protein LOC111348443 [Spodoptera litura]